MRMLVLMPHYCRRTAPSDAAPGMYGSESGDIAARARQVERAISALHQHLGRRQLLASRNAAAANEDATVELDVVIVTTPDQHLVDLLPRHLFIHAMTDKEPRALGFVCHELMRDNIGRYDWYAFMEDDLEITDGLFLQKLTWFGQQFGPSALLQPNRFEVASDLATNKLYIDGNTTRPELSALFQDITVRPRLEAEALGRTYAFQRVENPHSGCFFLTAQQLERVAHSPVFGTPSADFFGPLETAATLTVMSAFDVYKPARENANFLEIHHTGRRFLMPATPWAGTVQTAAAFPDAETAEPVSPPEPDHAEPEASIIEPEPGVDMAPELDPASASPLPSREGSGEGKPREPA